MTVNLSSRNFSLTIAGVDRTSELDSITLSQPSTLEQRHAPTTGSITLTFNPLRYNEFITIGNPTTAANWAVEAAVVYQVANDSGTLVNYFTGFILKEPSPPNIGFNEGTLQIDVGDILAYQSQRTVDRDVSGVTIGTNTDRDEIVVRVLEDAGITAHSIPSLGYPFNTPIQKTGGSPIKFVGDLVGADRHVLYCNASGTVIASPIDLAATAIATLTIGQDEEKFPPVDGSSIPTVTELTISGVVQEPDQGEYPILSVLERYITYRSLGFSAEYRVLVNRTTEDIQSENYKASYSEIHYSVIEADLLQGFVLREGDYFAINLQEEFTEFDLLFRLKRKTLKRYLRFSVVSNLVEVSFLTPFLESYREVEEYEYNEETGAIAEIKTTIFYGEVTTTSVSASLTLNTITRTAYQKNGTFWAKTVTTELNIQPPDVFAGNERRNITINGAVFPVVGCVDNLQPTTEESTSVIETKNDSSTRPPSITYSEAVKTRNKEVSATVTAIPLAGVPSKEKHEPLTVDWLTSDAQALEYGQLEIVLINGRKQCRFMVTALTDVLLTLRPRSRIDIVFNGILYRCLADAITFSQDLTKRSIGFMCDVISTSPADTPSTVYRPVTPILSLRGAITIDAIASGEFTQSFDVGTIIIDAVVNGVLAVQGQIDGEITIDVITFGILN
jgi:hypothetical protein